MNWPQIFSYFIYDHAIKGKYPDDFLEMKVLHTRSGLKKVFTSDQLVESVKFDSHFRDTFYKTNNLVGNIHVTTFRFRDRCKYCNCKNK